MWNNYWTFLDYLELRRRVEQHLARGHWLFLHLVIFLIANIVPTITHPRAAYYYDGAVYVNSVIGYLMLFWSLLLVGHALWTFSRSAAWASSRSQAIETELSEQMQSENTYLSDNPKGLFRIHDMLENDLRHRSSAVWWMTVYSGVNVFVWTASVFSAPEGSFAWHMMTIIALAILLPVLALTVLRNELHEQKLRKEMEGFVDRSRISRKQKRVPDAEMQARYLRLADDGELMMDDPKAKNR
jgi:hypothetical protein